MQSEIGIAVGAVTGAGAQPVLAQLTQLRQNFGTALVVMLMIGFIWGVTKVWSGANSISKGDPEGKSSLIGGILIAGAVGIMGTLYLIFGLGDAVLTPRI